MQCSVLSFWSDSCFCIIKRVTIVSHFVPVGLVNGVWWMNICPKCSISGEMILNSQRTYLTTIFGSWDDILKVFYLHYLQRGWSPHLRLLSSNLDCLPHTLFHLLPREELWLAASLEEAITFIVGTNIFLKKLTYLGSHLERAMETGNLQLRLLLLR